MIYLLLSIALAGQPGYLNCLNTKLPACGKAILPTNDPDKLNEKQLIILRCHQEVQRQCEAKYVK